MFNRVIKTSIRKLSHTHKSSDFVKVTSERIKELEKIIETQSNVLKDFEFEVKKQRGDGYWLGFLSGMIIMFGLRIVDDFTVSNRRKRIEIDIKKEIPPL
jgi:hypothetical protein